MEAITRNDDDGESLGPSEPKVLEARVLVVTQRFRIDLINNICVGQNSFRK